jgi:hypothetical protein
MRVRTRLSSRQEARCDAGAAREYLAHAALRPTDLGTNIPDRSLVVASPNGVSSTDLGAA